VLTNFVTIVYRSDGIMYNFLETTIFKLQFVALQRGLMEGACHEWLKDINFDNYEERSLGLLFIRYSPQKSVVGVWNYYI
jgi:hypothetical protein